MPRAMRAVLAIILIGVIIVCGGLALKDYLQYREASSEYDSLIDQFIQIENEEGDAPGEGAEAEMRPEGPYPELEIDYDGLRAVNRDFVGVLSVPVLGITYPVAQSKDDQEYLHRTFEGKNLFAGCLFLEKDSKADLSGTNSWIFGHNMNNGSMFGSLKKFLRDFRLCSKDPYFYLYTEDAVYKYRIFAYHTTSLGGPLYRYVENEEEYDAFLDDIKSENVYSSGWDSVDLTRRPRLVTLSTCYATGHTLSFVVHGALIEEFMQ